MDDNNKSNRRGFLKAAAGFAAGVAATKGAEKLIPEFPLEREPYELEALSKADAAEIGAVGAIMTLAKNAVTHYVHAGIESHPDAVANNKQFLRDHLTLIDKTLAATKDGHKLGTELIYNLKLLKRACKQDDRILASVASGYKTRRYAEVTHPDDEVFLETTRYSKEHNLTLVKDGIDAVVEFINRQIEAKQPGGMSR